MSIRTSTGRAVCGSVISTTIATARSAASHSTLVIRCRAVSSITTESWRTRKRTGAHSSPGRGGTHSVTATSQSPRAVRWWPPTRATRRDPLGVAPQDTPSAPRRCAGHTTGAPGESSAAAFRRKRTASRCTGTNRQRGGRRFPRIPRASSCGSVSSDAGVTTGAAATPQPRSAPTASATDRRAVQSEINLSISSARSRQPASSGPSSALTDQARQRHPGGVVQRRNGDPHCPSPLAAVDALRARSRAPVPVPAHLDPVARVLHQHFGGHVQRRLDHRRLDVHPGAVPVPDHQRRDGGERGVQARHRVADAAGNHRRAVGMPGHPGHPGRLLHRLREADAVAPRAVQAERRHSDHDRTGVGGRDRIPVQAEVLHHPRREVLQHQIARGNEL